MAVRRPAPVETLLSALPLFRDASPAHIAELALAARRVELRKGDRVYDTGGDAQGLYAVAFGLLKLTFGQSNGHTKVLRLVSAGETFGEPAVFFPHPYPVTAEALSDCLVLFLSAQAVTHIVESDRAALRAMLGTLSRRIFEMVEDLQSHTAKNGLQRVAAYLCSLAGLEGAVINGGQVRTEPVSVRLPTRKSVVASRLGVTKETFSRILHELTDAGLIAVSRLDITLCSPAGICGVARTGALPEAATPRRRRATLQAAAG